MEETSFVILRDGRRLAFSTSGHPGLPPVIHNHGMPGSRLEREAGLGLDRRLGAWVITPDRPGYGLSDPARSRSLLEWGDDVAELADSLGIATFGVTGLSGGGIYALACAARLPERVTKVVLSSCPAPLDNPDSMRSLPVMTRSAINLVRSSPRMASAIAVPAAWLLRQHPGLVLRVVDWHKPASDRRLLQSPGVWAGMIMNLREAMRRGPQGYLRDLTVLAGPWGFRAEDIDVPVEVWHGDRDNVVPLEHGRRLAGALNRATLQVCRGEAHMLMWAHLGEIVSAASAPAA